MRPLLAGARRALLWNVAAGVVIGLATAAAIVILVVLTEGFRDVDVAPYLAFFGVGYGLTLGTAAGGVHAVAYALLRAAGAPRQTVRAVATVVSLGNVVLLYALVDGLTLWGLLPFGAYVVLTPFAAGRAY